MKPMERFLLNVNRNAFTVYRKTEKYELQYVKGEPAFPYDGKRVALDLAELLNTLVEEYNLTSEKELEFTLVLGIDDAINGEVEKYLRERQCLGSDKSLTIRDLLARLYDKLAADSRLMVQQYGVNYDGVNYQKNSRQELVRQDFKLLAYPVNDENIIDVIGEL